MELGMPSGEHRVPRSLVGLAAALTVATLGESAVRTFGPADSLTGDPLVFTGEFLIGVATTAPFVVGLACAGYWLPRSPLEPDRYPRILRWVIGTAVASFLFNLVLIAVISVTSAGMFVSWIRWSVAVGSGLGLAVGVSEARAVQNSVEAARADTRASHVAEQRDLLDYLNGFLRHEILNTTQVISGHAELLMTEYGPESEAHARAETIHTRSEDITDVIQSVRWLLNANREQASLERTDAAAVLAGELAALKRRCDGVEIDASIPDEAWVRATPLLGRVFGNLLTNAVKHNDADVPSVRATMTRSSDAVTAEIADNGSGIPDEVAADLFERPDPVAVDHGMGLYLVRKLVDQYHGTVELVETGPDGSVFRVELPRAVADPDDRPTASTGGAPATRRVTDPPRSE